MESIRLSVDPELKAKLQRLFADAKQDKRTEADVLTDMIRAYNWQRFRRSLQQIQAAAQPIAKRLGIKTDEDVVDYIKGRGKFANQDGRGTA